MSAMSNNISLKNKILFAGVSEENPSSLNERIAINNFLAVFLGILSIPFSIFTYYYYTSIIIYPLLFIISCISIIFLNQLYLYRAARFISCTIFISLYSIYHAYLLPQGSESSGALYAVQIIFWLPPWLLVAINDIKILSFYVFYYALLSLGLPFYKDFFVIDTDTYLVREGELSYLLYCTSVIAVAGSLYILRITNNKANLRNQELISNMQSQQEQLQTNEYRLNEYIKEIEKAKEEDKIRQWRLDGIAKFNEIIRKDIQQIQMLYDEVIAEMVKYVLANQGGLFILHSEDKHEEHFLEMVSCYAYERSKYIDKKIHINEGLLGRVYQDREPLLMTEVPSDYVHITSGLGKALPRCILIVPLLYNDQLCGIIELASFNVFKPYHIEFVRRVGEIIASAILNAQINYKTQRLLAETQHQTEALRAQEEEMRQNMEELHATQEEMFRKQQEVEQANQKMQNNEQILKKTITKAKEKETAMQEQISILEEKLRSAGLDSI
jgi:ABC-type multidrug transport system fused ATPase/permease subunit